MNATTSTAWDETALPARVDPLRRRALAAGAVGLAAWAVLALLDRSFFPSYLVAFVFFLGMGVGSLGILMLHHLVGGTWGFIIRRPLEAATMTLPLMALLFLPILLGLPAIYRWASPDVVRGSETLARKAGYFQLGFWLARAALYLAVWNGLAFLLRRGSVAQERTEDPSPTRRNQGLSAPGLIALFLTVTFASIDWMMSIEPEWYSSIYGVMRLVSWGLAALCLMVVVAALLSDIRPLSDLARPGGFHDLGNLMLAFTMLWAYMAFSQYLVIWMGNLAEEIPWYLRRSEGGWRPVCMALMVFHFFVPFFCLLIRENKRQSDRLWRVAAAVLAMELVNDTWLVIPAYPRGQWMMLLGLVPAVLGVGGLWLWVFAGQLASRPLVPRHDPLLEDALAHHHGGGH